MTEQENNRELRVFEYPDFILSDGREETVYIAEKSTSAAARALGMTRWKFARRARELTNDDENYVIRGFAKASVGLPLIRVEGGFEELVISHPMSTEKEQKEEPEENKPTPEKYLSDAQKWARIYALLVSLNTTDELLETIWDMGIDESSHREFIVLVARELEQLE